MKSDLAALATPGSLEETIWDFTNGFRSWRLWLYFGALDVRQRYRRSAFGPFWLALGLGVTVFGIGILYSQILKVSPGTFVPFLGISLLFWQYISTSLTESTSLFQSSAQIITSMRVPYTSIASRMLLRNLIVFVHCIPPVVIAFLVYRYPVHFIAFAALPGLILLTVNLYWMSLLSAMVSLRYRDVGQVIIYGLQLAIFVTPIIWQPNRTSVNPAFIKFNPLYHMIQIVRAPVFDAVFPRESFVFCLIMAFFGLVSVFFAFWKMRRHLVHWL
jgi:lipopolysaccharide transport system permease protein